MSGIRASLRRRLRRRVRRLAGIDDLAKRLAVAERKLTKQDERLRRQRERLDNQNRRLREQRERFNAARPWRTQTLFDILGTQIAAMEERLQDLTAQVELGGYQATDQEKAEARNLLEEVRAEHHRVRVRFGAITRYEERLRRLESALAEEMAAAAELAHRAALEGALANAPIAGAVETPVDPEPDAASPRDATHPSAPRGR